MGIGVGVGLGIGVFYGKFACTIGKTFGGDYYFRHKGRVRPEVFPLAQSLALALVSFHFGKERSSSHKIRVQILRNMRSQNTDEMHKGKVCGAPEKIRCATAVGWNHRNTKKIPQIFFLEKHICFAYLLWNLPVHTNPQFITAILHPPWRSTIKLASQCASCWGGVNWAVATAQNQHQHLHRVGG